MGVVGRKTRDRICDMGVQPTSRTAHRTARDTGCKPAKTPLVCRTNSFT